MKKNTFPKLEMYVTWRLEHIYKRVCKLSLVTGSYNKVHEMVRAEFCEKQVKIVIGLRKAFDQLHDKYNFFLNMAHSDIMKVNK